MCDVKTCDDEFARPLDINVVLRVGTPLELKPHTFEFCRKHHHQITSQLPEEENAGTS